MTAVTSPVGPKCDANKPAPRGLGDPETRLGQTETSASSGPEHGEMSELISVQAKIQFIRDSKRDIQLVIRSVTSLESGSIRSTLASLYHICDNIATIILSVNSSESLEELTPPIVAIALKNLRDGVTALLQARYASIGELVRKILSRMPTLAFLLSVNVVSIAISVETLLRSLFCRLGTLRLRGIDSVVMTGLNNIKDPALQCQLLLIFLQEVKPPLLGNTSDVNIARSILSNATKQQRGHKLAGIAGVLLDKHVAATESADGNARRISSAKPPKVAVNDCRLEGTKIRSLKHRRMQIEITLVMDVQLEYSSNNAPDPNLIAQQAGLFVKESVFRAQTSRQSGGNEGTPSRKRSHQESSVDDTSVEAKNYVPSSDGRTARKAAHEALAIRCRLAGIKNGPPACPFASQTESEAKVHQFIADKSSVGDVPTSGEVSSKRTRGLLCTPLPILRAMPSGGELMKQEDGVEVQSPSAPPTLVSAESVSPTKADEKLDATTSPVEGSIEDASQYFQASGSRVEGSDSTHVHGGSHELETPPISGSTSSPSPKLQSTDRLLSRVDSLMAYNSPHYSPDPSPTYPPARAPGGRSMSVISPSTSFPPVSDEEEEELLASSASPALLTPMARMKPRPSLDSLRRSESMAVPKATAAPVEAHVAFTKAKTGIPSPTRNSIATLRASPATPSRESLIRSYGIRQAGSPILAQRLTPSSFTRKPALASSVKSASPSTLRTVHRRESLGSSQMLSSKETARTSTSPPQHQLRSPPTSGLSPKTPREAEIMLPFERMSAHLLGLLITCLGDCANMGTSRKSSAVISTSRTQDAAPPSADALRSELEVNNPDDPLITALIQARARGGLWVVHHHILQALRRISFYHPETLEAYEQLSSVYVLLAKSTECLRSSIARKALSVISDFYTPANASRKRLVDTGVAHILPACLKRASDQSNLFLADAAAQAYDAVVSIASEGVCLTALKPLIIKSSPVVTSHYYRATAMVAARMQSRLLGVNDIDKIITFAVKGLRDAASDSRSEARNLCSTISNCLAEASPAALNKLRVKVRLEDWVRLMEGR